MGGGAGPEGSFAGANRAAGRVQALRGPFHASEGHRVVFNVSHQRPGVAADRTDMPRTDWMSPGLIALLATAAATVAAAAVWRQR
jgi:hypothetical protein